MAATCFVHALKMISASTSMKTKPVVSMKPSRTNAQPSLGGMKIWPQIEHGTKPFIYARDSDNLVPV
jgi:hypothetical protein